MIFKKFSAKNEIRKASQFACAGLLAFTIGCATDIQKSQLSSNAEPDREIAELDNMVRQGYEDQVDVLAARDFQKGVKSLREAKSDMSDGDDREDILENVAYSRAYLERANTIADQRRPHIESVLVARSAALKANAQANTDLREKLEDLDEDIIDSSDDFRKRLNSEEIAELQAQYMNIELDAVREKHLAKAKAIVKDSEKNKDAKNRAPVSLKQAKTDIKTAENTIAVNRTDENTFSEAVMAANTSAQWLREVLVELDKNPKANEALALQLVQKNQRISKLQGTLGAAEADLQMMGTTLRDQGTQLERAQASVNMQQTINGVQKSFQRDEAEVFQQGSDVVIRLKKMSFPSGAATLPQNSIALLNKVEDVIDDLNTKVVVVEGHTDSTGGEKLNQELSQKRAEIVAEYLKSQSDDIEVQAVGYGFSRPIASNKSREGRTQNRRVDVILKLGRPAQMQSSLF